MSYRCRPRSSLHGGVRRLSASSTSGSFPEAWSIAAASLGRLVLGVLICFSAVSTHTRITGHSFIHRQRRQLRARSSIMQWVIVSALILRPWCLHECRALFGVWPQQFATTSSWRQSWYNVQYIPYVHACTYMYIQSRHVHVPVNACRAWSVVLLVCTDINYSILSSWIGNMMNFNVRSPLNDVRAELLFLLFARLSRLLQVSFDRFKEILHLSQFSFITFAGSVLRWWRNEWLVVVVESFLLIEINAH